jgi:hypothetical protein
MRSFSLVFLIVVLACSKTETPPEAKPDSNVAASKAPPVGSELVLPIGPAVVELQEPGKPPLQTLRWKLSEGSKDQVRVKSEMALEATLGSQNTPRTVTPTVRHELSIETLQVGSDGTAKMKLTVTDAQVLEGPAAPSQLVAQLKRSIGSTRGAHGTYEVSASGVVRGVEIDKSRVGPKNLQAIDNIEQLVYWTTVPVPTEPIGLGAKWKVSRILDEGGLRVEQVASYELTKIEDTRFEVTVAVHKTARPQTVTPPGTGPDESYQVTLYDSKGNGKVEADFGKPVPVRSKIDTVADMAMHTAAAQGDSEQLKVLMESSVSFEGT